MRIQLVDEAIRRRCSALCVRLRPLPGTTSSTMKVMRHAIWIVESLLLVAITVALFLRFDQHSHSASDTLRPLIITAAPLWLLSIAATRTWLRHAESSAKSGPPALGRSHPSDRRAV